MYTNSLSKCMYINTGLKFQHQLCLPFPLTHLLLQSLFTFSFTSFEPAFLFVLRSSFSQSNLHIGFNLRAFVICTNFLPSFLFNVFNFCPILFISVLTDLMHHSNSNNWISDLFLSGLFSTYLKFICLFLLFD